MSDDLEEIWDDYVALQRKRELIESEIELFRLAEIEIREVYPNSPDKTVNDALAERERLGLDSPNIKLVAELIPYINVPRIH